MDVFAIEKGKPLILSPDEFEKQTHHAYPYYRTNKDKRLCLYAICPICGNPIQIINMYGAEMIQNVTDRVCYYAKHTSKAVEGFPYWNIGVMKRCPLYRPSPLGNREVRINTEESEKIKRIIEDNWHQIKWDIRNIVGINLPNVVMEKIKEVFMNSHAYSYKAVNEYNIPYAMLRYQQMKLIFHSFLLKSDLSKTICDTINCQSMYFEVLNGEIKRKLNGRYYLGIYFSTCKKEIGKQYIHMSLCEVNEVGKEHPLFEEKIEMKPWIYE